MTLKRIQVNHEEWPYQAPEKEADCIARIRAEAAIGLWQLSPEEVRKGRIKKESEEESKMENKMEVEDEVKIKEEEE